MRYSFFLAAIVLVISPRVATAQHTHSLEAGARVRFWSGNEQLFAGVGTVVARDGDTITFRPDHCLEPCRPLRFTLGVLDSIDVRTGRSRAEGAALGGVIGLVTGLVVLAATPTDRSCPNNDNLSALGCAAREIGQRILPIDALVGLPALGVGLGALIGAGSQWRRFPLRGPAPRLSIAPSAGGGMTVGIRLPLDLAAPSRR